MSEDKTSLYFEENEYAGKFVKLHSTKIKDKLCYDIEYVDKEGVSHIGYGSSSLDVISDYLKRNFMPRWIPCHSRNIPDEEVLCKSFDKVIMIGYISENEYGKFVAENDNEIMYGVTAWMPLSVLG